MKRRSTCYLLGILPLFVLPAKAQLHFHNPSFELPGDIQVPPADWVRCVGMSNGELSGGYVFDTSAGSYAIAGAPSHGNYFYAPTIRSYYRDINGEIFYPDALQGIFSNTFTCGHLQKDHRYKMSFDARNYIGNLGNPYIYIYFGNSDCDSQQNVFERFLPEKEWETQHIAFTAREGWSSMTFRCRHMYKDTTTAQGLEAMSVFLDNFSPVAPDTAYNSLHFPIRLQCNGSSSYTLTSPYAGVQEQYWYEGGTRIGSGETVTVSKAGTYTLTLGEGDCIASVLQVSVYPGCSLTLHFPDAFTPNGDGRNETFRVLPNAELATLLHYRLEVYSRWGRWVFRTEDYTAGWDGGGFDAGVYFYICRYTLPDGAEKAVHGDVTLVR